MKALSKLREAIKDKIDDDFDFEVEHWWDGNCDDSYSYGLASGEQWTYREVLKMIKELEGK